MSHHILSGSRYVVIAILSIVMFMVDNSHAFELEGLIEPSETIEVSSQIPGVIDEITVERGDLVEKGQVVARLKSGVEQAAIALAKARVEFGKRKVNRNDELFQKRLISAHERDEIDTELKIAELKKEIEELKK